MVAWNEILTRGSKYWLYAMGGMTYSGGDKWNLRGGGDGSVNVLQALPGNGADEFQFGETNGGKLFLKYADTGRGMRYDPATQAFTLVDGEGTPLVPDESGGKVAFRIHAASELYLAKDPKILAPYLDVAALVASPDKDDQLSQWELSQKSGPPTVDPNDPNDPTRQRWLHTYVPQNRFSPKAFLEHVRIVVSGNDPVHNDPEYLSGLTDPLKQSILTKADHWESNFTAASPIQRAEANGAMLLASSRFYNHPTSDFNELDPRKPPEWSEVDDELGGNPYPG